MAPPSRNPEFYYVFVPIRLQDHRRYEGGLAYHITSTRLRIGLAQTLRRLHIAFVRLRAELTETSIAANHSMNYSVEH